MWSGASSVAVAGGGRGDVGGDADGAGVPVETQSPSGVEDAVPLRVVPPSLSDAEAVVPPDVGSSDTGSSLWRVPGVAAAMLLLVAAGVAGWQYSWRVRLAR